MRMAAVSVDLDEVACYARIHGLPVPAPEVEHAIYRAALPRFESLFAAEGLAATFFSVGSDLADRASAEIIRRLHAQGHEVANHTANHLYDLTRQQPEVVRQEIEAGARAIARVTGSQPVGFRAPGYTVTDAVFRFLSELGYRYDSSVLPCPAYYLAKLLAVSAIRARGRRSASVIGHPGVLTAPGDPYRVGVPYWRPGGGIWEVPIGVTRGPTSRLPYIGTTVMHYGAGTARRLTRWIVGRPLVNLELHGIDLADAGPDGLVFLLPYRPDLRRSLADRLECLRAVLDELRRAGYRLMTLAQAVEELSASG